MPDPTILIGLVALVALVLLRTWRRRGLARTREQALGTGLVFETDATTAASLVDDVASRTVSRPLGPGRWSLLTGFGEYDASAGWVRTPAGELAFAALTAPDREGAPDGAAWLDFRDRLTRSARKAGVPVRETDTGTFTASTARGGATVWTSSAHPA
ncbi:hypothetical protein [Mumia sp. DW29H23]|uniref:hypothetical protein n=1 Tax=Mumia sp. DW29H23 TaxID=3421241 RepID=UPI003D698239